MVGPRRDLQTLVQQLPHYMAMMSKKGRSLTQALIAEIESKTRTEGDDGIDMSGEAAMTRTETVHTVEHLRVCYGDDAVSGPTFKTPLGEWRLEPDGRYRLWRFDGQSAQGKA